MSKESKGLYEFGSFRLDIIEGLHDLNGTPIYLKPKELEVLIVLVEKAGRLVTREEIMARVWPDAFVEDANISKHIGELRKKLGLDIQNVPRKGYRLNAQVNRVDVIEPKAVMQERTTSTVIVEEIEADLRDLGESEPQSRNLKHRAVSATPKTRVLLIASLLAAIILASFLYLRQTAVTETPSLLILPFKPLNAEGADDTLQLGMADALIIRLSNTKKVKVRPTSSIIKYIGKEVDPAEAGRDAGVDLVLLGGIQKVDNHFRITVQLISIKDSSTKWATELDEYSDDILRVQDIVTEKLARALALNLSDREQGQLTKHPTSSLEAYELYLFGRYALRKRKEDRFKKAIDYFERAIAIDPGFALAHVGLADTYSLLGAGGYSGLPPEEVVRKAKAAVSSALEIDETLAEAHTSLGYIRWFYDWDWPGAEKEYRRAIELDPYYPVARQWYALYLATNGRLNEALAEMQTAQSLDPTSEIINTNLGSILYYLRRYDDAIQQYKKTLELDPNFSATRLNLGMAYELKGMYEEALSEYQKIGGEPKSPLVQALVGHALAASGRQAEARKVLDAVTASSNGKAGWGYFIALIYTGLNEKDQALEWLKKACAERSGHMTDINVDPMFDSLRSDRRFQGLLHCLGLD